MKDLFDMTGEVAVVTGASGNLGPVWIEALLERGASVLAVDRPQAVVSPEFKALLADNAQRLALAFTDVRDREGLRAACWQCEGEMGGANGSGEQCRDRPTPNKAGKPWGIDEIPFEVNREILEVNTLGAFLASQVFGMEMVKGGRGSIINIGSLYAVVSPDPRLYNHIPQDPPFLKPPAYGASKAALLNLTKYLSTLWAPHGVRVNALSPGGVLGKQRCRVQEEVL